MPIAGLATSGFLILFIQPSVLILGFELGIVALLIYYIRMVGYDRIQIAFGGVSLGLGGLTTYVAYNIGSGIIVFPGFSPDLTNLIFYVLLLVGIIQILAGILNLTTKEA
jgi:hypothetical protein